MAICLAQDGSWEPLRLEAVPALYDVDSFRWVASEIGKRCAQATEKHGKDL
jgi:hypothetical protein